jgi:alkylation response protein AidB-like acyl-CoA dehydrogenase
VIDVHLSDEQRALLERAAALAADVLAPIAAAGEPGRVNRPLVRALAEHGLVAAELPALDLCLIREGLARHCTEAETAFAVQGLGSSPLLGTAWEPRDTAVAAFALTEPGAGSDVAALSLAAERVGAGFRLTGEKAWISNAPDADVYTVFARTTPGAGARGLTAFAVPGDSEGLSGEPVSLIAPHPIGRLRFDSVFVPREGVLGEVDGGFAVAMATLDRFRPSVGAFAIGMARAALDLAVAYAAEREAFGQTLSRFQAVSHRLADVAARVEAARLLVHQAAVAYDRGVRPVGHLAAMAKLVATEVAQEAVDAAVQVHGARALEAGHPLAHLYAEVRAPRIYEGASEVQREIIARALFRAG